jgi:nitrogen fixation protein NifX
MGSETGVRVAFASSDRRHVDQHFGAAVSFVIHTVEADGARLVEVVQFGPLDRDGNEDKLAAKIAALEGCAAVYCEAIGASALNQLRALGVQPLKVPPGTLIAELVAALRGELRTGPSPWLARALSGQRGKDEHRFDTMAAEGWRE